MGTFLDFFSIELHNIWPLWPESPEYLYFYRESEFVDDPVNFIHTQEDLLLLSVLEFFFLLKNPFAGVHGKKSA